MYGALEVFSKSSLGAYLSQHARCLHFCKDSGDAVVRQVVSIAVLRL